MKKFSLLILLLPLVFSACKKDYTEIDRDLILQYIADNNLDAQEGLEGVFHVIDTVGNGVSPDISSDVVVDYEGFLLDGSKFDSSIDRGAPATFGLNQVIRGWQVGIPEFSEGGSGWLLIPSEAGYGNSSPSDDIPKNSVLVFSIRLHEVIN